MRKNKMGFRTYCSNKGCGKDNEPLLNTSTNEVECSECGKPITNITSFAKAQMKTLGQIKRDSKKGQAFSIECTFCKKSSPPKIDPNTERIVCAFCNSYLDYLSAPFVQIVKEFLKKKPDEKI
jgi:hypothetical protein